MDIKEIASEFRAFILKGNVVDLAVGVVIGAYFGKVVEALVGSIINPMLALFRILPPGTTGLSFAAVFTSIITFVTIAAVVFFLIVKPMNILTARMKRGEVAEPAAIPADIALLTEIRDLLKSQQGGAPQPAAPPLA